MTTGKLYREGDLKRFAEGTVGACLQWFSNAPKGRPIFCFVHLMDVHAMYDMPDPIAGRFVQEHYDADPLPICEIYEPGGIPNVYRLDEMPDFPGRHIGAYYVDRYDGCIAYTDWHIRRLVDALVEAADTHLTCIVTADHGEALGEDNYWCIHSHGVLPNQTQVPFIAWSNRPD